MRVAIIGGGGKMGRWFCRHLVSEGKEVIIADRDETKLREAGQIFGVETTLSSVAAVNKAQVILISVPIDAFERVVKEIAPFVHEGQVVLDITSIKTKPVATMHEYIRTGLVLGTHPVFGPGATSFMGHNLVLTPTNEKEEAFAEKVKRYLEGHGAKVKLMTPEAHDELMAVVLGLAHFIAIVSADALASLGNLEEMKPVSGTTFKVLLTLVESVIGEDPGLYAAIQMSLPNMAEIYKVLEKSQKTWAELVKDKRRPEFMERMSALKSYLEKNDAEFARAYQDKYRLAEGEINQSKGAKQP